MTVAPLGIGSVTTRYSSCSSGVSAADVLPPDSQFDQSALPDGQLRQRIRELVVAA